MLLFGGACATALVGACGSESAGEAFGGSSSSSGGGPADGSTGGPDGFGGADSGGGDGGSAPPPTTALFLQSSPSLADVRLCWGTAGSVAPVIPFPGTGEEPGSNYPGIPLGGVASMNDAKSLVGDLTVYAIDAWNLAKLEQDQATPYTCDQLICGPGPNAMASCLRYNLDYWPLGGTVSGLETGASNVVTLGGCLPSALDPNASAALCGASWTALSGNLGAQVVQLMTGGAPVEGGLAVQAAQLSPALAALLGDGGAAVVSFGPEGAADASPVATLQAEGVLAAPSVVSVGADLAAYGEIGFAVDVPGFDGGAGHLWMSLADSQQLVDPTEDPTVFFGQPRTYLVAVLGDPNAPHAFATGGDAGYDGKGLHVLVVPAPAPAPQAVVDGGAD